MKQVLDATGWCRKANLNINPRKTGVVPFTRRRKHGLTNPVMDGITIEFSEETKYLGVILDKKLSWNSQIKRVKDRAITALMTCRGIVGQRWGLKPAMMRWIYTMVVRPMVTYASFVWWPRAELATASAELQKVQRLACLLTTGAMKSAPTIALEAMLDLPPLPDMVKKEAAQSAFRMLDSYKPKTGDMQGHLRVYKDFQELMDTHPLSDRMPLKFDFEATFKVVIPERDEWDNIPTEQEAMVYYTDGSRKDGLVGMGIFGPSVRHFEALGTTPTIFQAEMYAINVCARLCLELEDISGKHVYIMSDSQAALRALKAHTFYSKLVFECLDILKKLTSRCRVTLMWVPGHTGIEGNELADQLANKGSETYFIGPEPFFGFNSSKHKRALNEWINERKCGHFDQLPANSLSRRFLDYSEKRTKMLLSLTKSEMKTVTGILTGHCGLKYHMHKIGKSQDSTCRLCMEESETAQHILCECPATARVRLKRWGEGFLDPTSIKTLNPKSILGYLKSIELTII